MFRGVPYAAPPIGAARWKAAQPHPGWDGVRDSAESGPSAPQPWLPGGMPPVGSHGAPPFGEDCLTLNLWTPGIDDARRPVMVWIHGGGFLTGSGSLPFYACDTFARNGDVVAISINYRLGPLGFLSGVGDANLWLTDQIAALQWVAANLAAFGGDPARVTLVGQSGGARLDRRSRSAPRDAGPIPARDSAESAAWARATHGGRSAGADKVACPPPRLRRSGCTTRGDVGAADSRHHRRHG